jgi:hypothetical protein
MTRGSKEEHEDRNADKNFEEDRETIAIMPVEIVGSQSISAACSKKERRAKQSPAGGILTTSESAPD